MFTHCCGHATIVARRQPFIRVNRILPAVSRPGRPRLRVRISAKSQPERDRTENFAAASSRIIACSTDVPTRVAANRRTPFEANPAATHRSIALRAMRGPKVTTPDIDRIRSDRVIFVRPVLFCACFRHAGCGHQVRAVGGSIVHTPDETTAYAICRRGFDRRRNRPMR
jgi:hypothetical protein